MHPDPSYARRFFQHSQDATCVTPARHNEVAEDVVEVARFVDLDVERLARRSADFVHGLGNLPADLGVMIG